jgi:hypothetical protein
MNAHGAPTNFDGGFAFALAFFARDLDGYSTQNGLGSHTVVC